LAGKETCSKWWLTDSGVFLRGSSLASFFQPPHLCSPLEETPQVPALFPHKCPKETGRYSFRRNSRVSLDTPPKERAAPGPQPVTARSHPQKTQQVANHFWLTINIQLRSEMNSCANPFSPSGQ
jgi:hypothetical protein